jgi:EAL domain-containing protein (putative c-di-GMP-specific phosphodiesterase class I)/GGDEF domain-containing protein
MTRGEANGERFIEMLIRAETTQPAGAAPDTVGRLAFFESLSAPTVTNQPRAALFAVVDAFASLEDRVGFDDAELVMQAAYAALRSRLSASDGLYRFSTHEFAMLVTRADANEFERLADVLVKELGTQVFSTPDHEAQISLTITVYPIGGNDQRNEIVGEMVREARKISTRGGGNKRVVLGATARATAVEREEQGKADVIKKAIEQNRLKLAYQTIASLEGDTRQHFDVLVRLVNESGEEMHASEFIKTAEKFGLMRSIDRWVVGRALKVVATREARADASMLFVKLSEDSLKDAEAFLAWLHEGLKGRPLGEDEVCFEIQELVLQNHIRKAKVLTKVLRDSGASVAIEHFGVGANSAQLIEHLPVNFLKFHASFTANFAEKEIQKKMSALMEMAKLRRIKTIVSHVEDANVMARMWQMGVNYIQGYHIQEPEVVMLAEEIARK